VAVSNLTGAQAQRELSPKRLGTPGIAASILVNRFEWDEAKLRTSLSGYISHLILILRGVRDFSERGVSNSAWGNVHQANGSLPIRQYLSNEKQSLSAYIANFYQPFRQALLAT
jgi:hypothetical protein